MKFLHRRGKRCLDTCVCFQSQSNIAHNYIRGCLEPLDRFISDINVFSRSRSWHVPCTVSSAWISLVMLPLSAWQTYIPASSSVRLRICRLPPPITAKRSRLEKRERYKEMRTRVEMLRWLFLPGNVLVLRNASHLELGAIMELKTGYSMDFISCGFSFMAWLHWKQHPRSEVSRGKQTTAPGSSPMIQRQDENGEKRVNLRWAANRRKK